MTEVRVPDGGESSAAGVVPHQTVTTRTVVLKRGVVTALRLTRHKTKQLVEVLQMFVFKAMKGFKISDI